jgi:hypothetical protein
VLWVISTALRSRLPFFLFVQAKKKATGQKRKADAIEKGTGENESGAEVESKRRSSKRKKVDDKPVEETKKVEETSSSSSSSSSSTTSTSSPSTTAEAPKEEKKAEQKEEQQAPVEEESAKKGKKGGRGKASKSKTEKKESTASKKTKSPARGGKKGKKHAKADEDGEENDQEMKDDKKDKKQKQQEEEEAKKKAEAEAKAKKEEKLSEYNEVLSFGSGDMAQLGLGHQTLERKNPAVVKGSRSVSSIACFFCVIRVVFFMFSGSFCLSALEGRDIVQIASGALHNAVVDHTGTVWTWGCNDDNGLLLFSCGCLYSPPTHRGLPLPALGRTVKEDSEEFLPGKVPTLDDEKVIAVACGDCHSICLTESGMTARLSVPSVSSVPSAVLTVCRPFLRSRVQLGYL